MTPSILVYMLNIAIKELRERDQRLEKLQNKLHRTDEESTEFEQLLSEKYNLIADTGIDYKETYAITEKFISKIKKENEEYPAIRLNMLSDRTISNDPTPKGATDYTAIREALQLLINGKCKEIN